MEESKSSKKPLVVLIVIGIVLLLVFFTTGFFVIQPIGAIPEGITIWYFRAGLNLGFIESADGILLEETGEVSLFSRAAVMGNVVELIEDRIIVRLPYLKFLYKISTGGVEFEE